MKQMLCSILCAVVPLALAFGLEEEIQPGAKDVFFAVTAIFKQEDPYLIEWLEYHALVGVERFYLMGNDCEKERTSLKLLAPYIDSGLVHYTSDFECSERGFSNRAYFESWRRSKSEATWVAHIDIDEFIVVRDVTKSVGDVFRGLPAAASVVLSWRIFGTNGHVKRPDEKSVIRAYTRRAKSQGSKDWRTRSFKSVSSTDLCLMPVTHGCARPMRGAKVMVDVRGRLVGCGDSQCHTLDAETQDTFDLLYLHHYRVKSNEEWNLKKKRGRPSVHAGSRPYTGAPPKEYNAVFDDALARNVRDRAKLLGRTAGPAARFKALERILHEKPPSGNYEERLY
ncbi:hypothetical protein M885DRAFT_620672 [Pelagophyceae sp. CCMP2097]|nr:hypothetical protein M885DRAFT_620672 [Pelagophyceae sp. CCMP2097]